MQVCGFRCNQDFKCKAGPGVMLINRPAFRKLMSNLRREYGSKAGTAGYYKMENAMAREEKKEHPWMTDSWAKRVAVDHLRGGKKK